MFLMKITLFLGLLFLTGCTFGTSSEIKVAEELLNQFECSNIDYEQLGHNPIIDFHQRTLAVSKVKANTYIDDYKAGDTLFDVPLSQIIQNEYKVFRSACYYLGGATQAAQE